MLQVEIEEQLHELTRKVEELSAEVKELKEEPTLIPGVEYDLVTSVPNKVIGTFTLRITGIRKADCTLALTDEEWRLYAAPEETT